MNALYALAINIYSVLIRLVSPFILKAKQLHHGRRETFGYLESKIEHNQAIVWVHCASLGEFEQGRPIIESIRTNYPNHKILLTFFSPSGYEIRKNYALADYICYLPADTKKNAEKLIKLTRPSIVFFVKYEFWHYYLNELKKNNIPTYLISAVFRKEQLFFSNTPWGKWYREMLYCFSHFFVQDEQSEKLLAQIGLSQTTCAGDTRFDRVAEIARNGKTIPLVEQFKGNSLLVVAGSTWKPDEELLAAYIHAHPEIKFVIAPHETKRANIDRLLNLLKANTICYTNADENRLTDSQVMIIDTIGILSSVYRYANMAYIGGGFGVGIHNTLEAAIFKMPIVFGPNYHKFNEAVGMAKLGIAFPIKDQNSLNTIFNELLSDEKRRTQIASECSKFVDRNLGATQIILNKVFNNQ